ncbi:MAG: T9SS type A sorting domain-containing protein [Bacteroidia bacterium]|nr:T9SS type A sorting domain-containing protein [Bacteroidia bacterium]
MREKSIIAVSLVLAGLVFCLILQARSGTRLLPRPFDTQIRWVSEEDEAKEQEEKAEWIEQMHKAAPGVNWRQLDQQTREQNYARFCNLPSSAKTTTLDTLANGALIGSWSQRGSRNVSGRVVVADLDTLNNFLYAGSDGGQVWRGSTDGKGWVPLNDLLRFPGLKMVRAIPYNGGTRILAASGGSAVWYSDDNGGSWQKAGGLTNIESWGYIRRAMVADDSARTVYVVSQEWDFGNWGATSGLYRSLDKGANFSLLRRFHENDYGNELNMDLWVSRSGEAPAYFKAHDSIFSLTATTNLQFEGKLPFTNKENSLLCGTLAGGDTTLYVYHDQDIYKSSDAGKNWSFISNLGKNPFFATSFSASLTDAANIFFGDVEAWRSTDSGLTWTKTNDWYTYYGAETNQLHADVPFIQPMFDGNGNEITYIGTDGGLYESYDHLVSVNNLALLDMACSQYYSVYTDKSLPDYIYAGSQDQGFQRCKQDSGNVLSFDQLISGDYGHIVSSDGGQSIWMVYPGFADYYSNARTGFSTATWNFNGANHFWIPPLMADPYFSNRVYMAGGYTTSGFGSHLISLRHFGGNITAIEDPFNFKAAANGGQISAMAYSEINRDVRYVMLDNGAFFWTLDNMATWTQSPNFQGPGAHYFYGADIEASKSVLGRVFIAGTGYSDPGVYMSKDHGLNWKAIDNGLPGTLVHQIALNTEETLLFAATEVGPYVYVIADDQWYPMSNGKAPDQNYWTMEYIPKINTVRFGTYGRGIWDFAVTSQPVSRREPMAEQNLTIFPNPAHQQFELSFTRDQGEQLEIRLWDISGKMVQSWQKMGNAGQNRIKLEVSGLPAGVYLCEVAGQGWHQTGKIWLQK